MDKIKTLVFANRRIASIICILSVAIIILWFQLGRIIFPVVADDARVDASLVSASLVATVGGEASAGVPILNNSWPGEIISSGIAQIQPQREGVITNWNVHIGETVWVGEILGKISAPPATPELIAMLAEKAEGLARAQSQAKVIDEFTIKEQQRLEALNDAVTGRASSNAGLSLAALSSMREKAIVQRDILRSFIERALARHIVLVSSVFDWRNFRFGTLDKQYGALNKNGQNEYELALIALIEKLKSSTKEAPIAEAQAYFSLLTQLANNSLDFESADKLKMLAAEDQKDFFEILGNYKMAQAEVADKETEYKLMINERGAMVEKERLMAHAEVRAMGTSYDTVAKEINSGSDIVAPRSGIVSAIYKKVGDLVGPEMSIAVIADGNSDSLFVRIQIPSNIRKSQKGELLTIVRPGFANDQRRAKIIGVGSSLDEMGSYMADAVFVDGTEGLGYSRGIDWPIGASVRAIVPQNVIASNIKFSSVWRDSGGAQYVWGMSDAGRIFSKQIKTGRILGSLVEVYEGLKQGDRYVLDPSPDIHEDMLINDVIKAEVKKSTKSGGHDSMPGM